MVAVLVRQIYEAESQGLRLPLEANVLDAVVVLCPAIEAVESPEAVDREPHHDRAVPGIQSEVSHHLLELVHPNTPSGCTSSCPYEEPVKLFNQLGTRFPGLGGIGFSGSDIRRPCDGCPSGEDHPNSFFLARAVVKNVEASTAEAVCQVEALLQELVDFSADLPSLGIPPHLLGSL